MSDVWVHKVCNDMVARWKQFGVGILAPHFRLWEVGRSLIPRICDVSLEMRLQLDLFVCDICLSFAPDMPDSARKEAKTSESDVTPEKTPEPEQHEKEAAEPEERQEEDPKTQEEGERYSNYHHHVSSQWAHFEGCSTLLETWPYWVYIDSCGDSIHIDLLSLPYTS